MAELAADTSLAHPDAGRTGGPRTSSSSAEGGAAEDVQTSDHADADRRPKRVLEGVKTSDKSDEAFRVYDGAPERVQRHYANMRAKQSVAFYAKMERLNSFEGGAYRRMLTLTEAFEQLQSYVDASDPDLDLPNLVHLLQTAEGIRRDGHPDWFQLVGLLHDMGKIQFLWGTGEDGLDGWSPDGDQWALGGDTFVLGCQLFDDIMILPELNRLSKDMQDPRFNTKYGIYEPHCGLDELKFAWGHDEYMYRMLVANNATIPREGLDMVRYHSAYPLHARGGYKHLLKPEDEERLPWIQLFNQYDLYTKDEDNVIDPHQLLQYYLEIAEKYGLGGQLRW